MFGEVYMMFDDCLMFSHFNASLMLVVLLELY